MKMADLLTSDCILLVGEHKGGPHKAVYVHVIQRVVSGGEEAIRSVESDIAEPEGLGPAVGLAGEVFGRAEHPKEPNDGEVDGVLQGAKLGGGHGAGKGVHVVDDGDGGRVGPLGRVVLVGKGFEETR